MRYFENILIKERVSIADMLFIYTRSRYVEAEVSKLGGKIFSLNILKTIKKLRILRKVVSYGP